MIGQKIVAVLRSKTSFKQRIFLFSLVMITIVFSSTIIGFLSHVEDIKQERLSAITLLVNELLVQNAGFSMNRGNQEELNATIDAIMAATPIHKIAISDTKNQLFLERMSDTALELEDTLTLVTPIYWHRVTPDFSDLALDESAISKETIKLGDLTYNVNIHAISKDVLKSLKNELIIIATGLLLLLPVVIIFYQSLTTPLFNLMQDLKAFRSHKRISSRQENFIDEFQDFSNTLRTAGNEIIEKNEQILAINQELKDRQIALEEQIQITSDEQIRADKANEKKDIFVSNMTHELKRPLSGIISGIELADINILDVLKILDQDPSDTAAINKSIKNALNTLKIAENSASEIHTHIQEILVAIQDIQVDTSLNASPIDLSPALDNLLASFRSKAEQKSLAFTVDNQMTQEAVVFTDWRLLSLILNALLSNAIRFTDQGRIEVMIAFIEQDQDYSLFEVTVSDTGCGIISEEQKEIYELFHISQSPEVKTGSGLGTGLSIAKKAAETLEGALTLLSSQENKGSVFHFSCPLFKATEEPATESTASLSKTPLNRPMRLLYVEDSSTNRLIFREYCEKGGVTLQLASNGKEGFQRFKTGKFDALVVDCYMPLISGYDLVEKIRAYEADNALPKSLIFALTADDSDNNKRKCLKAGFDEFISKPYTNEVFNQIVTQTLKYVEASSKLL